MNVSSWSIKNPIPSVLLFVLLTLLGVMSFRAMKVQQFPDIDLPLVTVTASLPGATADTLASTGHFDHSSTRAPPANRLTLAPVRPHGLDSDGLLRRHMTVLG